jgi:hypothetical protein
MNSMTIAHREHDVSDIERMARAIAGSKLFGITAPEQAIALCLIAQAEGRHPASAAQDYHIIQGRPSKKADAMLRDFLTAGGKVEWHALDDTVADATFSHPAGGSVRIQWNMERARTAKLTTDMWRKYPRQMLRSRVVSEGVRTVFPMATSGMYVPEEVAEFDAPAQRETVTTDGQVIDAAVSLPAPQSKAKSREPYVKLSAQIAACVTTNELLELWRSPEAGEVFRSLPEDWKEQIGAEKDAKKAALFDPASYLVTLHAEIADALTAELVQEVWDAADVEARLSDHEDKLQDAFDMKRDRIEALSQ